MFNDFRVVCAAVGLAIVTAGAPAVAQFAPPGSERYVGEQQAPPAGEIWADDDDDDDVAPPAQQPGQLTGPPPPFFLPPPAPFFATPAERPPVTAYEPGLTSRGYERDAPPRPPGSIDRDVQQPNQAPGRAPTAAPRPSPSNLASLPPEEQPEQASKELPPQFKRQLVNYESREPAGTIVIDTGNTYLYLVLGGGKALRYGIGVGREGFSWAGAERVSRMAEWPDWHPPAEMIERQPYRQSAGRARALPRQDALSHPRDQSAVHDRHLRVVGLHSSGQLRHRRSLHPRASRGPGGGAAKQAASDRSELGRILIIQRDALAELDLSGR